MRENILNALDESIRAKNITNNIIHNDLDGLLSGLYFYHMTNIPIGGIFILNSQSYMDSQLFTLNYHLNKSIFLDCSMCKEKALTVDHHVMPVDFYTENKYNCNAYNPDSKDIKQYGSFLHKNSTGNILWLMYIFNQDIKKLNNEQKLLLCTADSLYINYLDSRYKQNVIDWLKLFNMECLIDTLEQSNIKQKIIELKHKIGIVKNGYQIYNSNNKTFYSYKTNNITQTVINNICELMEWKDIKLPSFCYVHLFTNKEYYYSQLQEVKNNRNACTCAIRTIARNPVMYVSEYKETRKL